MTVCEALTVQLAVCVDEAVSVGEAVDEREEDEDLVDVGVAAELPDTVLVADFVDVAVRVIAADGDCEADCAHAPPMLASSAPASRSRRGHAPKRNSRAPRDMTYNKQRHVCWGARMNWKRRREKKRPVATARRGRRRKLRAGARCAQQASKNARDERVKPG